MRVIGTSGHVDHGKTALIKALTGIDTDRLPEEKARGLTIDLGFAHFNGSDGTPIGVIDVPGHERFIRNMVAGAWSLDCAILVIAADDGWMQQTTDHLRVLKYMGIRSVICAVTKIDAVQSDRISEVETEAEVRFLEITGSTASVLRVSAHTGEGIDALKAYVVERLAALPEKKHAGTFLYVDRVFSIQGAGVVVTGSLAGGPLRIDDTIHILPSGKRARIRSLQSYYSEVSEALPVSRLACNLQGLTREDIQRGCCLTTVPSEFMIADDFFVTIEGLQDLFASSTMKNHGEYEIAAGTFHSLCTVHYDKKFEICRLKLPAPAALKWHQPFVLIRHGGSRIITGGRVFWIWSGENRAAFSEALKALPEQIDNQHRRVFKLLLTGYIPDTEAGEAVRDISFPTETSGGFLFLTSYADKVRSSILESAGKPGGCSLQELQGAFGIDKEILEALTGPMKERGILSLRGQLLFSGKGPALSPFGKNLLQRIQSAGTAGFDPAKENIPGARKELSNISRAGLSVPLENGIHYSIETYLGVISAILKGRKPGDRFTIPEVKDRTSLSRKYSIPVLNRMEQDGYVKRDGDSRIVLKLPDAG